MITVKVKCDRRRCGREYEVTLFSPDEFRDVLLEGWAVMGGGFPTIGANKVILCDECLLEYREFLYGPTREAE